MRYKISVVIPIFNVEKCLSKCLNSVVEQTYKNIEIICVDDGSTDASGRICDEFAERDSRIIVIHKNNGGVSSARNAGLRVATGDFVSFIDSDDWLELDMYETLVNQLRDHNVDLVACGYYKEFGADSCAMKNEYTISASPMNTSDFLRCVFLRDKYRAVAAYLWVKLLKLEIIRENNLWFREDIEISEDSLFFSQYAVLSQQSLYVDKSLYHYVQREDSAIHNMTKRLQRMDSLTVYQEIIDLFEAKDLDKDIVDYVKRYYVRQGGILLQYSYENELYEYENVLRQNVFKYFDVYCAVNKEHPERIEWLKNLLKKQ